MVVYCLFMATDNGEGADIDWDLFGVYSTREKAEEARKWRRREDGKYWGCTDEHVYTRCDIDTRIIDYNLPKNN